VQLSLLSLFRGGAGVSIRNSAGSSNPLGLFEHALILRHTHRTQLLRSVVLVQHVVCVLSQLLHVRSDEHLSELDKVAVILIVDFNDTPRIRSTSNLSAVRQSDNVVGTDNSEGDFALHVS